MHDPSSFRSSVFAALSLGLFTPIAGCQTQPSEPLEHGMVWLRMLPSASAGVAEDSYADTETVEITLHYGECLRDFYQHQPDYRPTGRVGVEVFGPIEGGAEGWRDRLCENSNPAAVECRVERFRQDLDAGPPRLTVVYSIEDPAEIVNRELPFGPLPTADLAACPAGARPIVRLNDENSVRGLDATGETRWTMESFTPSKAETDQGAVIRVRAARTDA